MTEIDNFTRLSELEAVERGMGMHAAALLYLAEMAVDFSNPRRLLSMTCSILQLSAPADEHRRSLELARDVMIKRADEDRLNIFDLFTNDQGSSPPSDPVTKVELDEAKSNQLDHTRKIFEE